MIFLLKLSFLFSRNNRIFAEVFDSEVLIPNASELVVPLFLKKEKCIPSEKSISQGCSNRKTSRL